jgi:hypothetical protein
VICASALPVAWRKSSHSTNGGDCVEVGEDLIAVTWRKSSYSGPNGGDCLEAGEGVPGITWRKSSHSTNGGNCVEIGEGIPTAVPVRDSKAPHGPALIITPAAWTSFITAVRSGEFRS